MAKADQLLSLDQWPPEGRTLRDIVEQLIGPAALSELTEHTADRLSPRLKAIAKWTSIRLDAIEACQPLLLRWNSGALIAKGRRGDPLSASAEILPPSTNWVPRVVDFTHSVIEDPIGQGKEIFDLRFFPKPSPELESKDRTGTKTWIVAEAKRLKAAGEVDEGTRITDFAKLLEERMREVWKTDKSIKPVGWRHIKHTLPQLGLWPVRSTK